MKEHTGSGRRKLRWIAAVSAAVIVAAAVGVGLAQRSAGHGGPLPVDLPTTPSPTWGYIRRAAPRRTAG